jgi:hypothetical protein
MLDQLQEQSESIHGSKATTGWQLAVPNDQYGMGAGRPMSWVYWSTTSSGAGPAKK